MVSRWSLLFVVLVLSPACKKKEKEKAKDAGKQSPTLPKEMRHNLWLEEFPNCPGGNENMLAHHMKIKLDEGNRVTTAHLVRAPVKWYDGLNLVVEKRNHKVDISFGQCNMRSDDPKFRCEDESEITWYSKTSIDVDVAKHQAVPFPHPPKLDCIKGGPATVISIVAPRPGSGSGSSAHADGSAGSAGSSGSDVGSAGSATREKPGAGPGR